jgi:hypothetical protein
MAIASTKGVFYTRGDLRAESQRHAGLSYRPSAKDAQAPVNNPVASKLASMMVASLGGGPIGTGDSNLQDTLQAKGLTVSYTGGTGAPAAVRASIDRGHLVIAGVTWDGGGGHFFVIGGKHNGQYCILDPGQDGIQHAPVGTTRYLTGTIDGCLEITG